MRGLAARPTGYHDSNGKHWYAPAFERLHCSVGDGCLLIWNGGPQVLQAPIQKLLPEEMMLTILGKLPTAQLAVAQCVCLQWRALADNPDLWRAACSEAFRGHSDPKTDARLVRLQHRSAHLRSASVVQSGMPQNTVHLTSGPEKPFNQQLVTLSLGSSLCSMTSWVLLHIALLQQGLATWTVIHTSLCRASIRKLLASHSVSSLLHCLCADTGFKCILHSNGHARLYMEFLLARCMSGIQALHRDAVHIDPIDGSVAFRTWG